MSYTRVTFRLPPRRSTDSVVSLDLPAVDPATVVFLADSKCDPSWTLCMLGFRLIFWEREAEGAFYVDVDRRDTRIPFSGCRFSCIHDKQFFATSKRPRNPECTQ